MTVETGGWVKPQQTDLTAMADWFAYNAGLVRRDEMGWFANGLIAGLTLALLEPEWAKAILDDDTRRNGWDTEQNRDLARQRARRVAERYPQRSEG
jgi:hypothetical protein